MNNQQTTTQVECDTLYGFKKLVPLEKMYFRPSVYGIVTQTGKVLLLKMSHTGLYCVPGGGVELAETLEDALKREVKEEAGISIEVGRFVHFRESFFYYDPLDEAFHGFMFFYSCRPLTLDLVADDMVDDGEAVMPRWVDIGTLKAEDFNNDGVAIMQFLRTCDGEESAIG
jgi:8-oxo-dGTP pyrophosphatase MutT (NUDIX family)